MPSARQGSIKLYIPTELWVTVSADRFLRCVLLTRMEQRSFNFFGDLLGWRIRTRFRPPAYTHRADRIWGWSY